MTGRRLGPSSDAGAPLYALIALGVIAAAAWPHAQVPARDARWAPGLYAHVRTSEGTFTFRLLEREAPKTVANFVGLAEGTLDPSTGKPGRAARFYDGLTFHRVVRGFLIQGGDPSGDGTGGPGYRIADEIHPERNARFDRAGLLAMASHSPNQNGSQFFVTLAPAPTLNRKFTIFGEVVQGMDVVMRIGRGKTHVLREDRPVAPVRIESVRMERVTE